jgi:hypothetical protein
MLKLLLIPLRKLAEGVLALLGGAGALVAVIVAYGFGWRKDGE